MHTDGDNETTQNVLKNMVNNIPISQEHQELLDEEAMELMEESRQQENSASSAICRAPAQTLTPQIPPGDPIPLLKIQSWRAHWRFGPFSLIGAGPRIRKKR